MNRKALSLVIATVAVAIGLAATAGTAAGSQDATKPPIKIGAVAQLTGLAFATEVAKVSAAVFSEVNKSGGVNGHKIEYMVKDDALNPQRTAQVAREIVDSGKAVLLVGSTSFSDCPVNTGYYSQKNIVSIMGVGALPQCFSSPNIAPVNTGPFVPMLDMLYWASEVKKDRRICVLFTTVAGAQTAWRAIVTQWSKVTGKKLALYDDTLTADANWTSQMLRAKDANCDAVVYNGAENGALPILKAAQTQGMQSVDFLFFPPSYTLTFADAAKDLGMNVFVSSEFFPFTVESPATKQWRAFMERNNLPVTNFAEGGYLAAVIAVQVLKTIKGPITRDAVSKAFRTMKPVPNPLLGKPYFFGPAKTHQPNDSVVMLKLVKGRWTRASGFVSVPKAK